MRRNSAEAAETPDSIRGCAHSACLPPACCYAGRCWHRQAVSANVSFFLLEALKLSGNRGAHLITFPYGRQIK